jgi:AraC-like DNA-binding protein
VNVTRFAPSSDLAPYVRRFEVVEADEESERVLLPETSIIVGLRFAGAAALLEGDEARVLPDRAITGLRMTARRVRTAAGSGIVVAKFHQLGARAFVAAPLHRLFGKVRPLEEYVPAGAVAEAARTVRDAATTRERVSAFERFLLAQCRPPEPDRQVAQALRAIHAAPGSVRIAALAEDVGLSHDAFEKRFRRVVGATPKAYASIVHFRCVLEAYPRQRASLTELAFQAGFYDQSHFNRRFRLAAGEAPGRVLESDDYCGKD